MHLGTAADQEFFKLNTQTGQIILSQNLENNAAAQSRYEVNFPFCLLVHLSDTISLSFTDTVIMSPHPKDWRDIVLLSVLLLHLLPISCPD